MGRLRWIGIGLDRKSNHTPYMVGTLCTTKTQTGSVMSRYRHSPAPHSDRTDWQQKADDYWRQVQQLETEKAKLAEQVKILRGKKDIPPKKRGQWDAVTTRRVAADVGKPVVAAGITQTLFYKVFEDIGARYFMGLSIDSFWKDGDVTNWTTSLLVMIYAAIFKLFAKFDGK